MFSRYRYFLADSLRLTKLRHRDPELRRLSSLALGKMARLDPSHAAQTVLPAALGDVLSPNLLVRHGACLAVAEVTLALGQVCVCACVLFWTLNLSLSVCVWFGSVLFGQYFFLFLWICIYSPLKRDKGDAG